MKCPVRRVFTLLSEVSCVPLLEGRSSDGDCRVHLVYDASPNRPSPPLWAAQQANQGWKTSAVHNVDTTTDKQFIWMQCVAPRCEYVHREAGKESDGSANSKEKKRKNLSLQLHKVNRSLHRIELKNNSVAASDFTAGQIAQTNTPAHTLTHSLPPFLSPSLLVV